MNYVEEMMKTAGVEPTRARNFTAEKQLEIIKLIINEFDELKIFNISYENSPYNISVIDDYYRCEYDSEDKDFTQALARLTIKLIKAEEIDRVKVKEILEDSNV